MEWSIHKIMYLGCPCPLPNNPTSHKRLKRGRQGVEGNSPQLCHRLAMILQRSSCKAAHWRRLLQKLPGLPQDPQLKSCCQRAGSAAGPGRSDRRLRSGRLRRGRAQSQMSLPEIPAQTTTGWTQSFQKMGELAWNSPPPGWWVEGDTRSKYLCSSLVEICDQKQRWSLLLVLQWQSGCSFQAWVSVSGDRDGNLE